MSDIGHLYEWRVTRQSGQTRFAAVLSLVWLGWKSGPKIYHQVFDGVTHASHV
jgi:hypothetical protein